MAGAYAASRGPVYIVGAGRRKLTQADISTDKGGEPMKVSIDYDLCEANAVCAGLVPEVFEVDDDDNTNILVDEVPAQLLDQVRHAVRSCPKAAISLQD
jgi:ferredoxin